MNENNTHTRIDDITEKNKPLTEFKDGKYRLDFGYKIEETIYIETKGDTLLLITTQGVLKINLDKLRISNMTEEVKKDWFELD